MRGSSPKWYGPTTLDLARRGAALPVYLGVHNLRKVFGASRAGYLAADAVSAVLNRQSSWRKIMSWALASATARRITVSFAAVAIALLALAVAPSAVLASAGSNVSRATVPREIAALPRSTGYDVGDAFPDVKGKDQYGNKFSLKKLRGKFVLLEFATWWCTGHWTSEVTSELKRQLIKAGVPFEVVTVVLEGPVEGGGSSTRSQAELYAVAASSSGPVVYNPYDPLDDKTGGLWAAYQGLDPTVVPSRAMISPDGELLGKLDDYSMQPGTVAEIIFDWVNSFTMAPLPPPSPSEDYDGPLDRTDLSLTLTSGDGTKLQVPKSFQGQPFLPFDTGVLANPGGPRVTMYAQYKMFDLHMNPGGHVNQFQAHAFVKFPAGSPPPVGAASISLDNFKTRTFGGGTRPFALENAAVSVDYCQDDPLAGGIGSFSMGGGGAFTTCMNPATDGSSDLFSASRNLDLPAVDSFGNGPYWAANNVPFQTFLDVGIHGNILPPGNSFEALTELIDSFSWSEKTREALNKKILKSIKNIPSKKACKTLDKTAAKVTKLADAALIPTGDATQVNDMVASIKDLIGCGTTSVTTTTSTVLGAPTTTLLLGCDEQPTCELCQICQINEAHGTCNDEKLACLNDTDCNNWYQCYYSCGDQACQDQCTLDYAVGYAAWQSSVVACSETECPTACPSPCGVGNKCIFVTSTTSTGNLGGLAGADATCNTRASAAALPGTYVAWLSDGSTTALSRVTSNGPYATPAGDLVANSKADLTDGTLGSAINDDENGGTPGGATEVWTGTGSNGLGSGGCVNWTSGSAAQTATVGLDTNTNFSWSAAYAQFCNRTDVHLYCVQQ